MRVFTRDLMGQMEMDLETQLDWVAANHYDTAKPHTHKRLARATVSFHHASSPKEQLDALIETHKITLTLSGQFKGRTYHQVIVEDEIKPLSWRGDMVNLLRSLEYDVLKGHDRKEWIARARLHLEPYLDSTTGTIAQKIPNSSSIDDLLAINPVTGLSARTIHEVKGKEYLGICVVMTSKTAKGILDYLKGEDNGKDESAREIYVAASRAEQLLAIACPKSQAGKLSEYLSKSGALVELIKLWE